MSWIGYLIYFGFGAFILGMIWLIRSDQLKTVRRSNGSKPIFLGEKKWPSFPNEEVMRAKSDVISSPVFFLGWLGLFAVMFILYQTVGAQMADGKSLVCQIMIITGVVLAAMVLHQYALALLVRKRLTASKSRVGQ